MATAASTPVQGTRHMDMDWLFLTSGNKCTCGGEMFTIYTYGKQKGEQIVNKDAVMLLSGWDSGHVVSGRIGKLSCLPATTEMHLRPLGGKAFKIFKV